MIIRNGNIVSVGKNSKINNFNNSSSYFSNGTSISDSKIQLGSLGNRKIIIGGRDITEEVKKILETKQIIDVKEEKVIKSYDMKKYDIEINKIVTKDQSSIDISEEIINKKELNIKTSGQSTVKIEKLKLFKAIINCSGQSEVSGNMIMQECEIDTSGQSSVNDIMCNEEANLNSSGQSSIRITAHKKCQVSKDSSGQSSIKVTRTNIE
jgi:hypothetical protein